MLSVMTDKCTGSHHNRLRAGWNAPRFKWGRSSARVASNRAFAHLSSVTAISKHAVTAPSRAVTTPMSSIEARSGSRTDVGIDRARERAESAAASAASISRVGAPLVRTVHHVERARCSRTCSSWTCGTERGLSRAFDSEPTVALVMPGWRGTGPPKAVLAVSDSRSAEAPAVRLGAARRAARGRAVTRATRRYESTVRDAPVTGASRRV